jgi:polypeptide N-acetylgalactosaminyltransferase
MISLPLVKFIFKTNFNLDCFYIFFYFNHLGYLKDDLNLYLAENFGSKVRVLRNEKREGLIRSRLLGAKEAKSEILVFLDSHIEVTDGWLKPLISLIKENETNVVTPIINSINSRTFQFSKDINSSIHVGGFDWNMRFKWYPLRDDLSKNRQTNYEAVESPTMAGGLFAISKRYFESIGTYDSKMEIWGGENLEISFRIWMCGGRLLTTPCSHIGHIFRKKSPYIFQKQQNNIIKNNLIRVAEVWMDDYKNIFYERFNHNLV